MISNCHINCIGIDSDNTMQSVVNELDNFLINVRAWCICFYIHAYTSPQDTFLSQTIAFQCVETFGLFSLS